MEFPDLGQHCSLADCKQLDFLPFVCSNCKLTFCKNHFNTSQHDCKCLNEFFKIPANENNSVTYTCSMVDCNDTSYVEMLCKGCTKHYCVCHRHHGCLDHFSNAEIKKQKVHEMKAPKIKFQLAKDEADKKVERNLRKAEMNPQTQNFASKVRLMKLKSKALGDNKVPTNSRVYFAVHPPVLGNDCNYKPQPLFASTSWTVGKSIDVFSKRMRVENKNNEVNEPKLRLFKVSDGSIISLRTDIRMEELINSGVLLDGDSLILEYVDNKLLEEKLEANERFFLPNMDNLVKYQSATV